MKIKQFFSQRNLNGFRDILLSKSLKSIQNNIFQQQITVFTIVHIIKIQIFTKIFSCKL